MTEVVTFYEKPGCLSNATQKEFLRGLGHRLDVRDLLAEPWTPRSLRRFFGNRPVGEWFNPTAPRVKSGSVQPHLLDEAQALKILAADPILIRRPLIETSVGFCCGFESGPVLDALGVRLDPGQDLQSCSKPGPDARCEPPETIECT
jgi:nitrogenase-associated protein